MGSHLPLSFGFPVQIFNSVYTAIKHFAILYHIIVIDMLVGFLLETTVGVDNMTFVVLFIYLFIYLLFIYLFIYFAVLGLSCGMQDLH